ncbi:hypothetical protein LX64_02534 [Chitinophaga skermanii]|uniref:Activator of Hsp90 ATPase-like protein n=1 Tax=Chitinophaga skermanii TaxID=331697 RepID=A0A327QL33_9BACT|nr:SRPBCC domain-containing protein [Chitinophaga skermanii]RAJ05376.1 hypothetical protein LX64_02534 [Chitinophaga skermanii]
MRNSTYSIDIKASKHIVWDVLWDEDSYPEWTTVFSQNNHIETNSWEKGSKILFVNGNNDGMVAEIVDIRKENSISFRHLGEVMNGVEDYTTDIAKKVAGSLEAYTLEEFHGITTLTVSIDFDPEYKDYFDKTWPQALQKVKEISEL